MHEENDHELDADDIKEAEHSRYKGFKKDRKLDESRPRRPAKAQPYVTALSNFIASRPLDKELGITVPTKLRYDIYTPLLLLPPSSPLFNHPWSTYLSSLSSRDLSDFYTSLADSFNVTHVAINQPIPAKEAADGNIIRSPQITCLHGDFGKVEDDNFEHGFWVSTSQHGIYQTWAPLHTMFSRGNISEKERIYNLTKSHLSSRDRSLGPVAAVDLFVGIGYFAFSYLKAGIDVVLGWDINPWSIEGCRIGGEKNKWSVSVAAEVMCSRLLLYEESNEHAPRRLQNQKMVNNAHGADWPHIAHINLGLLPTSEPAYVHAISVLLLNDTNEVSWIHVHENTAKDDVEALTNKTLGKLCGLAVECGLDAQFFCEHVEFVKSWAPGVWHCVFDVRVERADSTRGY